MTVDVAGSNGNVAGDGTEAADAPKFTIFHFRDGKQPEDIMSVQPGNADNMPLIEQCIEAGIMEGADHRVVFSAFGMSIIHIWFKRSYPLPRHSHDTDCLYYIIAGSLRLGTEELGIGDGFFLPANTPYTYTAGPDGVELIEFRSTETFDYRDRTGKAFWEKALRLTQENREAWQQARRPSGNVLS